MAKPFFVSVEMCGEDYVCAGTALLLVTYLLIRGIQSVFHIVQNQII